jgi:hypothetical protein
MNVGGMSDDQIRGEVRKELLGAMANNRKRQKVIALAVH